MNFYERFRALKSVMAAYDLDWDDLIDAGFTRGMYDMLAAEYARLVESVKRRKTLLSTRLTAENLILCSAKKWS